MTDELADLRERTIQRIEQHYLTICEDADPKEVAYAEKWAQFLWDIMEAADR